MSKQTDDFYACFSFFYPLVDVFLRPQKRVLFREVNRVPPGKLLDIGVGNGRHLHEYKAHQVTGIDTSATMLAIAGKHKCGNVVLLQMNGESLYFRDGTFDYVILSHVIAVVDEPDKLLEEVFRVLKPDGKIFILNHFTPANCLRHLDRSFRFVSKVFHFKSFFHINSLEAIKKFNLVREVRLGPLAYFKLLIYSKA